MEREKKEKVGGNRKRKLGGDRRSWRTVQEQRVGKHRKAWRELKGLAKGGPRGESGRDSSETRVKRMTAWSPYLHRSSSNRSGDRHPTLDDHVTAGRCHSNCYWGGEEGGNKGKREEPWSVVSVDDGGGTAVIGSSVVGGGRSDVSALPRSPVVPLEAVVVA